jgi:hypothetical protein
MGKDGREGRFGHDYGNCHTIFTHTQQNPLYTVTMSMSIAALLNEKTLGDIGKISRCLSYLGVVYPPDITKDDYKRSHIKDDMVGDISKFSRYLSYLNLVYPHVFPHQPKAMSLAGDAATSFTYIKNDLAGLCEEINHHNVGRLAVDCMNIPDVLGDIQRYVTYLPKTLSIYSNRP